MTNPRSAESPPVPCQVWSGLCGGGLPSPAAGRALHTWLRRQGVGKGGWALANQAKLRCSHSSSDWPRREKPSLIWSKNQCRLLLLLLLLLKGCVERCGWADGVGHVFLHPSLPSPPFWCPGVNYSVGFAASVADFWGLQRGWFLPQRVWLVLCSPRAREMMGGQPRVPLVGLETSSSSGRQQGQYKSLPA